MYKLFLIFVEIETKKCTKHQNNPDVRTLYENMKVS